MSDLPERLWLEPDKNVFAVHDIKPTDDEVLDPDQVVEYVGPQALDALLEKAVKAALEEAALYAEDGFCCRRCGAAFVGRVGHYDEDCPYNDAHWNSLDDEHRADAIRAIDPATIVQKVKA